MDQAFRLSPQQRRLWKLQGEGRLSPYRATCAVALAGELDSARLRQAVAAVIDRHEILRTVFRRRPDVELPLQVVMPPGASPLREVDLTGIPSAEQGGRIGDVLEKMDWSQADLAAEPPLRITLVTLAPARSVLVIGLPALCADGAGLRNLVREIAAAYAAEDAVPEEPVQYADLAEWLNAMLEREDTLEERERWSRLDLAALHAVRLPFETSSPGTAFAVGAVTVPVLEGGEWSESLAARSAERGTAISVFLLAAWSVLLARWTGSSEVTIGTLYEGRHYEGLDEAVGIFARVLPLGVQIEPSESFAVLLGRLDAAVRDVHDRQDYFGWEEADFVSFAFELDEELPPHPAGAVTFSPLTAYSRTCLDRFRLKLRGVSEGDAVRLELQYDLRAFALQDVERLAGQLATLLGNALDTPGSPVAHLEVMPAAEQGNLLELDADAGPPAQGCVHHLFAEQARRVPDAVAAVCREDSVTYAELERRANRLAHTLLRLGVAPGARVACCLPRSLEVLIGLLGTLKAGAAFVPLDPQQPTDRLALMLEELEAPVLLTTVRLAGSLPTTEARVLRLDADREEIAAESAAPPNVAVSDASLAYVIFTSGSTGRPKGVAVEHRQLFNYVTGVTARLELPAGASYATVSTFAADLGHTMIFPSLCSGGTLQVIGEELVTDPEALSDAFALQPVDCLKIVPSHLASLLAAASRPER
ncbi:MAG TPA: AMP-binding protein, partial [Thermoanaerobaculia bacterium]|nr:AMP-binding protein [Thermoanaerobaculia bacterium]